jgi:CheY-like chemotaxis protein
MRSSKPVLLVEDDSIDAMTVRRAFKDLKLSNQLAHCVNGEEAVRYLQGAQNESPVSSSSISTCRA